MISNIKLIKISLTISIIGILLLLLISSNITPHLFYINDINNNLLNKQVTISGTIFNIKNYNNFQVISIKDSSGKIDITTDKNLDLKYNDHIIVTGVIREYNEYLQLKANTIKITQANA